jgi:hypothetical protein
VCSSDLKRVREDGIWGTLPPGMSLVSLLIKVYPTEVFLQETS